MKPRTRIVSTVRASRPRSPAMLTMSLLLAVLALLPGMANAQMARALQSADAAAIDGGRVLVTLTLSSEAPEPIVFPNESPARVSIDLPLTRLAMAERYRKVNLAKVQALSAAENKDRTRLVIELTQMVGYKVRVDGNRIFVTIDALPSANAPLSSGVPPQNYSTLSGPVSALSAAPVMPAVASITHIDFRRGENGEGRIIVSLDNPQAVVNVSDEGNRVVARFRNVNLADAQVRRLDVLDFATPVKFVDALKAGADAQIVIVPVTGGDFEQKTTQLGNQTIIELQPLSQTQRDERKKTDPQYTGEKVSLSFQSIDIRSLLQIIADVAGTNMVVSDSVTGEIAMRLQNVPWDQALDIILRTKGLGMRQQGNVMIVAPLAELAERDKIEAEARSRRWSSRRCARS